MKHLPFIFATTLVSLTTTALAEAVYICPQANGKSEYTAVYRVGCRDANLKKIEGYQPAVSATNTLNNTEQPETSSPPAPQTGTVDVTTELAAAERALTEGKVVRYGNERNYANYQERIRQLEDNVIRARENAQRAHDDPSAH